MWDRYLLGVVHLLPPVISYRGRLPRPTSLTVRQVLDRRMARKRQADTQMDRKQQPANKDRSNNADRSGTDRRARDGRTGEGSESALATLKSIERDRKRSRPAEDRSDDWA